MKLLLTLDNDEKVTVNCEFRNVDTVMQEVGMCGRCGAIIEYTHQLPLTHKMFKYYLTHQVSFPYVEVLEELHRRNVSSILITLKQALYITEEHFRSLNTQGFLHSTFINRGLTNNPRVVGYVLDDYTVVTQDSALCDVLTKLYEHYSELQLFRDLEPEYNEETFVDIIKAEKIKE